MSTSCSSTSRPIDDGVVGQGDEGPTRPTMLDDAIAALRAAPLGRRRARRPRSSVGGRARGPRSWARRRRRCGSRSPAARSARRCSSRSSVLGRERTLERLARRPRHGPADDRCSDGGRPGPPRSSLASAPVEPGGSPHRARLRSLGFVASTSGSRSSRCGSGIAPRRRAGRRRDRRARRRAVRRAAVAGAAGPARPRARPVGGGSSPIDRRDRRQAGRATGSPRPTPAPTTSADRGVPDDAILLEVHGTNTWESLAAPRADPARDAGSTEVVLVTDPYHALRVGGIAEEVGLDADVSPTRPAGCRAARAEHWRGRPVAVALGRIIGYRRLPAVGRLSRPRPVLAVDSPSHRRRNDKWTQRLTMPDRPSGVV